MKCKNLSDRIKNYKTSFGLWVCKTFGHSFSSLDVLMFQIECEGRCYTVNTLTGERKLTERKPEIKCRRCGETFSKENTESTQS